MAKQKKQRCYLYLRVSTDIQVEGYSLDAQRERLDPLGRAGEFPSAFADPDKLAALAEEFGLEA